MTRNQPAEVESHSYTSELFSPMAMWRPSGAQFNTRSQMNPKPYTYITFTRVTRLRNESPMNNKNPIQSQTEAPISLIKFNLTSDQKIDEP